MISKKEKNNFFKSTEGNESLLFWMKCFFILFAVLTVSLVFNPGWIFTEWGFYSNFLQSMIVDHDFNIINQVETSKAWLVTKNYFHPSIHPESQIALMAPLYLFEYISNYFVPTREFKLDLALTGFLMNLFSILSGFYFNKKTAELFKLKFGLFEMMLFYLGCPLLFFSLFQATVVEIATFPLVSYLVFVLFQSKFNQFPRSLGCFSIVVGFLFITKITFWPLAAFVSFILLRQKFKARDYKNIAIYFFLIALLVICNSVNLWLKYGYPSNPGPPLEIFADFSVDNIATNILYGFFPQGGLFFASPLYGFSFVGFLIFLFINFRNNFLNLTETIFYFFWIIFIFFHQVIMMGYIVEDHLPGRIHLAAAPLLIIGFAFLKQKLKHKMGRWADFILILFSTWHVLITFFYFVVIQISSFLYATQMIPNKEVFEKGLPIYVNTISKNLNMYTRHFYQVIFYTGIVSIFLTVIRKHILKERIVSVVTTSCFVLFVVMTCSNWIFSERNILKMKEAGFFHGKVVGNGREIYAMDYVLDYAKTISSRQNVEINAKLVPMIERYYKKIEEQILVSTPELAAAVKNRSSDFSFSIHHEEKKIQSQNHSNTKDQ